MKYFVEIKLNNRNFNVGFYIEADSVEAATPESPFILPVPRDGSEYDYDLEVVLVEAIE